MFFTRYMLNYGMEFSNHGRAKISFLIFLMVIAASAYIVFSKPSYTTDEEALQTPTETPAATTSGTIINTNFP